MRKGWTGDQVQVNFEPNGAELDLTQCKLFINNQEQALSGPPRILPAVSRATSTLQFSWDTAYPEGDYSSEWTSSPPRASR